MKWFADKTLNIPFSTPIFVHIKSICLVRNQSERQIAGYLSAYIVFLPPE
ncbi:hypothetical protein [Kluyvera intermedia]